MKPSHAVTALAALAQETRLALFRLLVEIGPEGCPAGEIGVSLNIPPNTLSFHLKTLTQAGLLHARQEGRFIFYAANYLAMDDLINFLTKNCCNGRACLPKTEAIIRAESCPETYSVEISMPLVLILCTGNSCRSQMAEALVNHDLAGKVRALSAGTKPQPRVADGAIAALRQAGISVEGLTPKDIDAVIDQPIDLVVTVCDNAQESCPIFPRPIPRIHLPFHDPHGEPPESFMAVRDDIRARLIPRLREVFSL